LTSASKQSSYVLRDDLSIVDLAKEVWRSKWLIAAIALAAGLICVVVVLMIPNRYTSEATLAPAPESQPLIGRSVAAQLSGLAGINLGGAGGADKTAIAMSLLKSRAFLADFARRHGLEVALIAGKRWERDSGELVIDRRVYDPETDAWVRTPEAGRTSEPTDGELYEVLRSLIDVDQDRATGLVSLDVDALSPQLARDWAGWLIEDVNTQMRAREISEAERSIRFLGAKAETTQIAEVKEVLYQLMQEQVQRRMLADVREDFSLIVVDPPMLPELKSWPPRSLLCIAATLLGGIFGIAIVAMRSVFRQSRSSA
jgi:uncharacterized protein involved in exopolysaccharide biosynthesis